MTSKSDQNLLFGIIALQMDFVRREQLVAAASTWLTDKSRQVDEILVEQGALKESDRELLAPLVARHLDNHGDDPQRSLAALSGIGSVADELRSLGDENVEATLSMVASDQMSNLREETSVHESKATLSAAAAKRDTADYRFRVLRSHAKGGLGEVYVARDTELNREVALKEIQSKYADDEASRLRFLLEAEVTGGLEHPGIVPVYGLGRYEDGRPFYAMRFIKGDSLQEAADRFHGRAKSDAQAEHEDFPTGGRSPHPVDFAGLEFRKLLGRFIDVCQAIEYAHSRGVLHRDLKPGNVMLGKYGETLVVDWGLAKAQGRDEAGKVEGETTLRPASASGSVPTMMGSAIGTPAFMPPEQAAGELEKLGPASDVYSLGATLYYLLTGDAPFQGSEISELLVRVRTGGFPSPRSIQPAVPTALAAICMKAMALRPHDRYPSPKRLADDVERFLADEPIVALREPLTTRAQRWIRKHRTFSTTAAAVFVISFLGLSTFSIIINGKNRELFQANLGESNARREAEAKEREADAQRKVAESALKENRRVAANLAYDRARQLSEKGEADAGLSWFVRAMELSPTDDAAFLDLIRENVSQWQDEFVGVENVLLSRGGDTRRVKLAGDGATAYIAVDNEGVMLWNTLTGEHVRTLRVKDFRQNPDFSTSGDIGLPVAISPNDQVCAAASLGKVYFWNVEDGSAAGEPISINDPIVALEFNPSGDAIAVGTKSRTVFLYELKTRKQLREWTAQASQVSCLAFRPDGKVLLTGAYDGALRRWDVSTGEEIEPELKRGHPIVSVAWSPDGMRLLAGDWQQFRMWDLTNNRPVFEKRVGGTVHSIDFSPSGRRFAIAADNATATIHDAATGERLFPPLRHIGSVDVVAFDSTGSHLFTANGPTFRRWRIPDDKVRTYSFTDAQLNRSALQPNGQLLAVGGMAGKIQLRNIDTGEQIGQALNLGEPVASLAFSEDGTKIVAGGFRGTCRVFATDDLEPVGKPIKGGGAIMGCAFLDENRVITASLDGWVRCADFRSGEVYGSELEHQYASSVDVVGDNLLSAGADGSVRMWSLSARRGAAVVDGLFGNQWKCVSFNHGGDYFAAGGDRGVQVWATSSSKQHADLPHPASVTRLSFSSDDRLLLTSCHDEAVRLWHVATGKLVGPVRRFPDLCQVHFDKHNRIVATYTDPRDSKLDVRLQPTRLPASTDTLRVWAEVKTGFELMQDGTLRVLTPAEWAKRKEQLLSIPAE